LNIKILKIQIIFVTQEKLKDLIKYIKQFLELSQIEKLKIIILQKK